ncbi:PepSY-associated TM helix domain-containing protein [Ruegeria lacuscaerulensis]|uniref:PepSY-associated TM helix domain-containing protein n=1 Tax=Ruegeria lacuscaerulensis TaxID=55218 RepID=UPI0030141806
MFDIRLRIPSWHRLHSFLGLGASLFFAFMFLTGTLLVFAPELDWLRYSEVRASPQGSAKLSLGTIYDAAARARPDWDIVTLVRSEGAWFADQVTGVRPEGRDAFLWVNPYTGQVNGETSSFTIHAALLRLHEALFIPGRLGKLVVTVFAIPLTATVIAGLFLYRRFWTGFFRWPRFSSRSRAWLSDLHRLIAVWSLVFFVPLVVTSLWYMVETVGLNAPATPANRTVARDQLLPPDFNGARLDAASAIAAATLPGLEVRKVILPRRPAQPIVFQGDHTAVLVRPRANAVYFHPESLEVLGAHRGEDLSLHQRIAEAADPIHFGTWGGLPTRILWGLFGVGLTALAVIGIIIHAKRVGIMQQKIAGASARSGFARVWRGMGPWGLGGWLSVGLVVTGLALLTRNFLGA